MTLLFNIFSMLRNNKKQKSRKKIVCLFLVDEIYFIYLLTKISRMENCLFPLKITTKEKPKT